MPLDDPALDPEVTDVAVDEPVDEPAVEATGEDDGPSGVILTLLPADPASLEVPGGDPAEELHVTMVYVTGDASTLTADQIAAVAQAVDPVIAAQPVISARVAGIATLGEEGAVVLLLEAPELDAMREAMMSAVVATGIPLAEQFPQFIAHLTVGYSDVPADLISAALPLQNSTITFGSVGFHLAGEVFDRPLGGTQPSAPAVEAPGPESGDVGASFAVSHAWEFAPSPTKPKRDPRDIKRVDDGRFAPDSGSLPPRGDRPGAGGATSKDGPQAKKPPAAADAPASGGSGGGGGDGPVKSGGSSSGRAPTPEEKAAWEKAVNEIVQRDGVSEEEANKRLQNLLKNEGAKPAEKPAAGPKPGLLDPIDELPQVVAKAAPRPDAPNLEEDDPFPDTSPSGAPIADFKGAGSGVVVYADGSIYDGLGWQKKAGQASIHGATEMANPFHGEDGRFAPKVVEMAATPPAPPVLVGLKALDSEIVPALGEGLPYLVEGVPYLALLEVYAPPEAVLAALDGIGDEEYESVGTSALSASGPFRRAILVDPTNLVSVYETIKEAVTAAELKFKDYPFAVQLGAVSKEDARALKGTEMRFGGLIIVSADGSVAGAASPDQQEVQMDDTATQPEATMTTQSTAEMAEGDPEMMEGAQPIVGEDGMPMCPQCGSPLDETGTECPACGWVVGQPVEGAAPTAPAAPMEMATVTNEIDVTMEASSSGQATWEGLLAVEGVMSGDGRTIDMGALTWRELPLPLMMMTQNPVGGEGHDGAQLCGRIDWIERREGSQPDVGEIWGGGVVDTGSEFGQEAARLVSDRMLRGVSVDLDDTEMAVEGPEDANPMDLLMGGGTLYVQKARIMGATLTPFPAFQEAQIAMVNGDALAASLMGEGCDCELAEALVAAAGAPLPGAQFRVFTPVNPEGMALVAAASAPVRPPLEWFQPTKFDAPQPFSVTADGRLTGYVATWGSCHIGFRDRCVGVPKSASNYRYFANKKVQCADGTLVATGPIVVDTVHPDLRLKASDAQAFYADTGCAVADVALYEDEIGIQACGALRPTATPEQVRTLRASDVSPDWRAINGRLECVGLLAVNTSGFITPALVAAAGHPSATGGGDWRPRPVQPGKIAARFDATSGEVLALVAAGIPARSADDDVMSEMRALADELRPLAQARVAERAERAAAITARFKAQRAEALATKKTALAARFR